MRKKKGGKGSLFLYCLCFLMLLPAGCGRKEAGLYVYGLPEEEREPWLSAAYEDIKAAFSYYLEHYEEIPELTGAYIDGERGALKVPDVSPEDYPPGLSIFSEGIYHLYDYQFFYRNLEENVGVRLEAYAEERAMDQAA